MFNNRVIPLVLPLLCSDLFALFSEDEELQSSLPELSASSQRVPPNLERKDSKSPTPLRKSRSDLPKSTVSPAPSPPRTPPPEEILPLPPIFLSPRSISPRSRSTSPFKININKAHIDWENDNIITTVLGWDIIEYICFLADDYKTISSFRCCDKEAYEKLAYIQYAILAADQVEYIKKIRGLKKIKHLDTRGKIIDWALQTQNLQIEEILEVVGQDYLQILESWIEKPSNLSRGTLDTKSSLDNLTDILNCHLEIIYFFETAKSIIKQYYRKNGSQFQKHKARFLKIAFFIEDAIEENTLRIIIIPELAMQAIKKAFPKSLEFYKKHPFSYNPLEKKLNTCFWSKPDEDPFWIFLSNYANHAQKEFLDYISENNLLPESKKE